MFLEVNTYHKEKQHEVTERRDFRKSKEDFNEA